MPLFPPVLHLFYPTLPELLRAIKSIEHAEPGNYAVMLQRTKKSQQSIFEKAWISYGRGAVLALVYVRTTKLLVS